MEDIFLKNLPSLDLHGYDRETARVATEDFIDENIILKNDKILIIHGKGLGVVRKSVHNVLSKRKEIQISISLLTSIRDFSIAIITFLSFLQTKKSYIYAIAINPDKNTRWASPYSF